MTPAEAILHIKSCPPNPAKFVQRGRGVVDWKFGELAEYVGYAAARGEVEHKRRMWYDWQQKYGDCLLERSFADFLTAEKELSHE